MSHMLRDCGVIPRTDDPSADTPWAELDRDSRGNPVDVYGLKVRPAGWSGDGFVILSFEDAGQRPYTPYGGSFIDREHVRVLWRMDRDDPFPPDAYTVFGWDECVEVLW